MDKSERQKKLEETLKEFNKRAKSEVFKFGDQIENNEVISTGIPSIDNFIGGGFKRGAHTIVWGGYSVGKTSLTLTTLGSAQKEGLTCCYVNLEKPIDRERFEFFGVDLSQMVYIEAPNNAEQALEALRTLCKNKVIDLFIIDSVQGLSPKSVQEDKGEKERGLDKANVAALARTLSQFYNIVNADVFRSKAAVLWVGQTRTGGIGSFYIRAEMTGGDAQNFYAYMKIFMRKDQKANNPVQKFKEYFVDPEGKLRFKTVSDDIGFSLVMRMDKTNSSSSAKEHKELVIPFYSESGFRTPVLTDDVPIRIALDMSKEDQEKTRELMKEKGVLPSDEEVLNNPKSVLVTREFTKEETEALNNPVLQEELEKQFTEAIEKPVKQKRGRKPKKNG